MEPPTDRMIIFVRDDAYRRTIPLEVELHHSILQVKSLLPPFPDHPRVPSEKHRLVFAGVVLDNEKTVEDYKLAPENTLHLLLFVPKPFPILLISLKQERFTIQIRETDTIEEVKEKVGEITGHPADQLKLIHMGKFLTESPIGSSRVKEGDRVVFLWKKPADKQN